MKKVKNKSQKRYRAIYEYREQLIKQGYTPSEATEKTANKFDVTIMTVYNAIKEVRSSLCTQE
jgi:DNA invertase Pin-like site-specific DNA recombinase